MFSLEEVQQLQTFNMCHNVPEEWTLEETFREYGFEPQDISNYYKGKALHEQGYYLVSSYESPVANFPFEPRYPNGHPVPQERLLSPVFVFTCGYVSTSQMYYGTAIVKRLD